jgi:hypothetical protein
MGLLDDLLALGRGAGRQVRPVELLPGEREVHRTAGSVLAGGLAAVGGDIVVTDQRLLFAPLDVTQVSSLLTAGLKRAGAPGASTTLVGWIADRVEGSATAVRVAAIRPGANASLMRPPSVVVTTSDGRTVELAVLASRTTANVSVANTAARDRLVSVVSTHLVDTPAAGRVGPPAVSPLGASAAATPSPTSSTAALSDAEMEAASTWSDDGRGTLRVVLPFARPKSAHAHLDPRLVGTWEVPVTGSVTLAATGRLTGALQMFGALPVGAAEGEWWLDGSPEALVLSFTCVQRDATTAVELVTSWPLVITHVSPAHLVVSEGGEGMVLTRLS